VFFDVDFTLIYPGPAFQGEGYQRFCAGHGIRTDPALFDAAVKASSFIIDDVEEPAYDHELFVRYTASIIEYMGGRGPNVVHAAREIYGQWATNHHFELYDNVEPVLRDLVERGYVLGAISNSHRSLDAFCDHFSLRGLIHATVSSFEHGYLKPHPSIFEAALRAVGTEPAEAVMVGDSLVHDIEGARRLGMRAILVARAGGPVAGCPADVPVIRSLHELHALLLPPST
jgi:HAD superfamily hydrolase (TIGR01662 family)